jgi:phage baseplate assembly protein W
MATNQPRPITAPQSRNLTRQRTRYRAFRFLYPGLDTDDEVGAGLRFTPRGGIDMVEYNESVRQAILLLVSTKLGERVMRPDYGCLIHRLIFSPNDDTTAGLAIFYVQQALDRWEPRIDVVSLDAGRSPVYASRLEVMLEYRVKATRWTETMTISLDLSGEEN